MADRTGEGGFTIVETVVAAAVLATALVGLAQVIAVATTAAVRARDMTRATLAAAQKLEELRADAFATPPVDASDVVDGRFRRRWTITALPSGRAFRLAVEVAPLSISGSSVRLETIRAGTARELDQ